MQQPPLLPEETLARVLRLARLDGISVLAVATLFALMAAVNGDFVGAVIGLLVAGAGAIEMHGGTLLQHGEIRGVNWLVGSQLFLMLSILVYCLLRLLHPDDTLIRDNITDEMKASLQNIGWSIDKFLGFFNLLTYGVLALATLIYQGGMAVYYFRRRRALEQALEEEM